MKKEDLNKWVQALKSKQYTQSSFVLKNGKDTSYCCLGVLCDVVKNDYNLSWEPIFDGELFAIAINNTEIKRSDKPPLLLMEQLKLSEEVCNKLMYMNDRENKTFEEIAAWIEENIQPEEECS